MPAISPLQKHHPAKETNESGGDPSNIEVIKSSGNIFADLGVSNPQEAEAKALISLHIEQIVERSNLSLEAAAEQAGISLIYLANILRGKVRNFTVEQLSDIRDTLRKAE